MDFLSKLIFHVIGLLFLVGGGVLLGENLPHDYSHYGFAGVILLYWLIFYPKGSD